MSLSRFPEKYIQRGDFVLHSGGRTDRLYDINYLLTNNYWREAILGNLPSARHYVGIATGGAIIAALGAERYHRRFSIVKDGKLKGEMPRGDFVLIDDVVTTGGSLLEALALFKNKPKRVFVVADRRIEKELVGGVEVVSMFEVEG